MELSGTLSLGNSDSIPSKYTYSTAKSQKFSMAMVRVIIDRLLASPLNNLYPIIERYLGEPGMIGRTSWDQCMATQAILQCDASEEHGGTGELTKMVEGNQLTMPTIGNELAKVLKKSNFIMERGRITGVVEASDQD